MVRVPRSAPIESDRVDRSFQTDAQAKPARPDGGIASDGLDPLLSKSDRVDRSFQTDAQAKPARPDGGIASDGLDPPLSNPIVSTGRFRRTRRQSRRVLTAASQATP